MPGNREYGVTSCSRRPGRHRGTSPRPPTAGCTTARPDASASVRGRSPRAARPQRPRASPPASLRRAAPAIVVRGERIARRTRSDRRPRARVPSRELARREHALDTEQRGASVRDSSRRTPRRLRASSTAATARRVLSAERGAASSASAASDDTAHSGRRAANAMPFAVAMPMRRPVNEPGPAPTATASSSRRRRRRRATHAASIATSRSAPCGPLASWSRLGEHAHQPSTIATLGGQRRGIEPEDARTVTGRRSA